MTELIIDQKTRDEILREEECMVVSASAGSGKTTIIVRKMNDTSNKYIKDHRTMAAITFTTKATEEIRKKIIKMGFEAIVVTNDSFVEFEVIRPFLKDTEFFKNEYSNDFTVNYSSAYKFSESKEGFLLLKEKNILGTYTSATENFKFQLACYILENSIAARQYLKAKYYMIFIDEYQDSDEQMHRFFMFLRKEIGIKLMIVGDKKQAIYKWRGATSNIFEILEREDFVHYQLFHNFRCHIDIQNYANFFHDIDQFQKRGDNIENVILARFDNIVQTLKNLIQQEIIDIDKEVTIISNFTIHAKSIEQELNLAGYNFIFIPRTPLDNGSLNNHLLKCLAYYYKNNDYSIYDFLNDIYFENINKDNVHAIDSIINLNTSLSSLEEILRDLSNYLGISITNNEINDFVETINNPDYDKAYLLNEEKHRIMTVFGAKGLEFDQVFGFSSQYNIANNSANNHQVENHYVCITRARDKFVMLLDDRNENYLKYVEKSLIYRKEKSIYKLL
ncbi:UvrD-helicase domain-containing protein [Paenibacillus sp. WLX1005]|uniref:UvrD-helicase domain-containing protein n=1 Tax=Paenibacillus sp. WLX1005 TaxID=3243766 RepID=UPI003983DBFA